MTTRLDQAGDVNHEELVKYAQLYPFPDFVKSAQTSDLTTPPPTARNLYADPRGSGQFPCHTPAATVVSYTFFLNKKAEINPKVVPLIEERLNSHIHYWRIKAACQAIAKQHEELHKQAELPDSAFAFVQAVNGHKVRQFRISNTGEVKAAAQAFEQSLPDFRLQFPFGDRQKIAKRILKKAEQLGAMIPESAMLTLEKSAGHGLNPPLQIAEHIRNRIKAARKAPPLVIASMQKLAEDVANKPQAFLDPATTYMLADSLDKFDRAYGLLNKYSEVIPSPEDVVFGLTYKQANAAVEAACSSITGTIYDREDFSKLSVHDVQEAFGHDIARQVSKGLNVDPEKMAEFVSTMPLPDAQMFDDLMSSKQLRPIAKEAKHYGLTPSAYAEIMKAK